jgi:ADP-ribosylglycohydrolase
MVKLALDGVDPSEYPQRVLKFGYGISAEFDAAVERVQAALGWHDEEAALNHIGPTRGGGWVAEEAIAMALYCVLRHPNDFVACVRLAANISGDSDSVASIAGGLVAARMGCDVLPGAWLERLENRDYLINLANRLADKKVEMNAAAQQAAGLV